MTRRLFQSLDELPEHLRGQAAAQLAAQPKKEPYHIAEATEMIKRPPRQSHKKGVMNKEEARFAEYLDATHGRGWRFEAVTFRLANRCNYTPDFVSFHKMMIWEVKAWWKRSWRVGWTEDARIKWKMLAELYPEFSVCAAWWRADLGQWEFEYAK